MENAHKFFSNKDCKYFPCHTMPNNVEFNCLFCYCPLYPLGEKCNGLFKLSGEKRIKNCIGCHLPHLPEYYDVVISKLKELLFTNPAR